MAEAGESLIECADVVALAERVFACTAVPTCDWHQSFLNILHKGAVSSIMQPTRMIARYARRGERGDAVTVWIDERYSRFSVGPYA